MLRTVEARKLRDADQVIQAYREAVYSNRSTLLVEYAERYKDRAPSGVGQKDSVSREAVGG
jgi:hypothetical protein